MPPRLPQGSFLVDDTDRLGLSVKQLSREGNFTPSRGIRLPLYSTGSVTDNVRAYSRLDPTCVLTHSTSARICCICLPAWLDQDWRIHIARPADGWKPRRRNVLGQQLSFKPGEVTMSDGVRLRSPSAGPLRARHRRTNRQLMTPNLDLRSCSRFARQEVPRFMRFTAARRVSRSLRAT